MGTSPSLAFVVACSCRALKSPRRLRLSGAGPHRFPDPLRCNYQNSFQHCRMYHRGHGCGDVGLDCPIGKRLCCSDCKYKVALVYGCVHVWVMLADVY